MRHVTYNQGHKAWQIEHRLCDLLGQALQARVPAGTYATELEAAESLGKCDSNSGSLRRTMCHTSGMNCVLYSGRVHLCAPVCTCVPPMLVPAGAWTCSFPHTHHYL